MFEDKTELHRATRDEGVNRTRSLDNHQMDADCRDAGSWTPLHMAAIRGQKELTNLLIEERASVDVATADGVTALYIASDYGNTELVSLLLDRGANIQAAKRNGFTPLCIASQNGNVEVTKLLVQKGASVNVTDERGWTPLHKAAACGNEEVAKLLIERGANADASSKHGATPLYIAAEHGKAKMAKLLIEKGANRDAPNKNGATPLFIAATNGRTEVTKLLLSKGAVIDAPACDGSTPLRVAHFHSKDVEDLLLQCGANSEWKTQKMSFDSLCKFSRCSTDLAETYAAVVNGEYGLSPNFAVNVVMSYNFASLKDIWIGHNILLLSQRCGIKLEKEKNPDFWYMKLYKHLYKCSTGCEELAGSILEDAKANGLIERTHVLVADMAVDLQSGWMKTFQQLSPLLKDIYERLFHVEDGLARENYLRGDSLEKVSRKLHVMQQRLEIETRARKNIEDALMQLQKDMKSSMRRRKYLNFVRLGLSLIPVAGGCLSVGLETAGEMVASAMSGAKDVGNLILSTYEAAEGATMSRRGVDMSNPQMLETFFSPGRMRLLPEETQKLLNDCVGSVFGDMSELRLELGQVLHVIKSGDADAALLMRERNIECLDQEDVVGQTLPDDYIGCTLDEKVDNNAENALIMERADPEKSFAHVIAEDLVLFVCDGYKKADAESVLQQIQYNAERNHINRAALLSSRAISAETLAGVLLEGVVPAEAFERKVDGRIITTLEYILRAREAQNV